MVNHYKNRHLGKYVWNFFLKQILREERQKPTKVPCCSSGHDLRPTNIWSNFIATSHDGFTPNGGDCKGNPLDFQGNLGWLSGGKCVW